MSLLFYLFYITCITRNITSTIHRLQFGIRYHGTQKDEEYHLINLPYFTLSITNNQTVLKYCNEHIETYPVQPGTDYYLIVTAEESIFETEINTDKIYHYRATCDSNMHSFPELLQFENIIHEHRGVQIWSVSHAEDIDADRRNLILVADKPDPTDLDESFEISSTLDLGFNDSMWSTLDLSFSSTALLDTVEDAPIVEYEWYEFWKLGWWQSGDWSPPKIITAVLVILVVLAIIIFPIVCYVQKDKNDELSVKKRNYRDQVRKGAKQKGRGGGIPAVLSPKAITPRYESVNPNTDDSETDPDEDAGKHAETTKRKTQNAEPNKTEIKSPYDIEMEVTSNRLSRGESGMDDGKEEEKKATETRTTPHDEDAAPDTVSDVNISMMSTGMFSAELPRASHENVDEGDELEESASETNSEELYAVAGHAGQTQGGTAGAIAAAYPPGSAGRGSMHSAYSTSTGVTAMDKQSIKSGLRAAEMTLGQNDNAANNHVLINMNDSLPTDGNGEGGGSGEGLIWDNWLKETLQECFPDEWQSYLARFKEQRITEDVLLSLSADKQNKSDVWKELMPVIGHRVRFQKAWDDELMRRQLNHDVSFKHGT